MDVSIRYYDAECYVFVSCQWNFGFKHCKNCKSLLYFFFFFLHYIPCSINYNTLYMDKRHNNVIEIEYPRDSFLFSDTYK